MTQQTFKTTIYFNEKSYEATVVGDFTQAEPQTLLDPPVYASFDIINCFLQVDTLGQIDLLSEDYKWAITQEFITILEQDFFDTLKGEDYDY